MSHQIVLLTKPALPGLVKTRLCSADGSGALVLDAEQAANLHRAFLMDTTTTLERVCAERADSAFSIAWALDGGLQPEPGFERFSGFAQVGDTLGDRLLHALHRAGGEAGEVVVAVGSDHPEMSREVVEEAIDVVAAGRADLAIGPAHDGGYYLLSVRRQFLTSALFDGIAWSTGSVYEQTVQRADGVGLKVHSVVAGHDCDTPQDLAGLYGRLIEAANTEEFGAQRGSPRDGTGSATREWLIENYPAGPVALLGAPAMCSGSRSPLSLMIERLQEEGGVVSRSEAETAEVGAVLGQALAGPVAAEASPLPHVVLLEGEMGAGKTALVKGVAVGLGVDPASVQSPTFTLLNEYQDATGATRLVHGDLYRLEPEEVEGAGVLDALFKEDCVVIIEWSERLPHPVPGAVTLRLSRLIGGTATKDSSEGELEEVGLSQQAQQSRDTRVNTRRIEWV